MSGKEKERKGGKQGEVRKKRRKGEVSLERERKRKVAEEKLKVATCENKEEKGKSGERQ